MKIRPVNNPTMISKYSRKNIFKSPTLRIRFEMIKLKEKKVILKADNMKKTRLLATIS